MIINKVYTLDKYEQAIVKLSAEQRHNNKIKTGWDGSKTVNEKSMLELNIVGFGGEFIFARENNLYPDFKIHNTSKVLKTDDYDATWLGHSVDVKVNRKDHSARRGLIAMVSRRRKLIDYIKKHSNEDYMAIIKKLDKRK